jgi:hypothetical protein
MVGGPSAQRLNAESRRLDRLGEALGATERECRHRAGLGGRLGSGAVSTSLCKSSRQSASPAAASVLPRSSSNRHRSPAGGRSASTRPRKAISDSGAPWHPAARAGSTSRSTTQPSPTGSLSSRCSAARSYPIGRSASSRAARRWPGPRSVPESSAQSPPRTTGWRESQWPAGAAASVPSGRPGRSQGLRLTVHLRRRASG